MHLPLTSRGRRRRLGLLLLAGACASVLAQTPTPRPSDPAPTEVSPALARRLAAATVVLTTRENRKTGVVISADGLILTCLHGTTRDVVETVTFSDGTRGTARPLGGATDADLALLQLQGPAPTALACLPVAERLAVGDPVILVGTGGQVGKYNLTPGRVTRANVAATTKANMAGTVRERFSRAIAVVDGESVPGDSGGPLVTSAGTVVGIISGVTWQNQRSVVCPAGEIARLLPVLRQGTWVPPLTGKEQIACYLAALPADLAPLRANLPAEVDRDLDAAAARVAAELQGAWGKATRLTYEMTVTGFDRVEAAGEAVIMRRLRENRAKP